MDFLANTPPLEAQGEFMNLFFSTLTGIIWLDYAPICESDIFVCAAIDRPIHVIEAHVVATVSLIAVFLNKMVPYHNP